MITGSVILAPNFTTENPYSLIDGCIKFKNEQVILTFLNNNGIPIINHNDQVSITKALNDAYQNGYTRGFDAPKYI